MVSPTSATSGVAVRMPIKAGSNAIATSAEPKPVRLWVKTARKITRETSSKLSKLDAERQENR